jgi:glycosyltransferase involved in cell wall biosynthesis
MTQSYCASVVIPTYQRCGVLQQLLEQLRHQTVPACEYEVIVSIDGSDDGTREMVAQCRAPYALRVLWQPHSGRAAACNAGIRAAQGELVVVLDDDMMPCPEFLRAHVTAHAGDARCGVLGAVPVEVAEPAPPVAAYIAAKFNRHLEKLARPDHVFALRDFYSGNFSIRRALLLEAGLFDEAFKEYGNEDLELSVRLARAGIRLKYSVQALARQRYAKTFAALAQDTIAKGRTAVLLAAKHPQAFDGLKLATFHRASLRWRLVRSVLLQLSELIPATPAWLARIVAAVERRRPRHLHLLYDLALDYFYWVGASRALSERRLRRPNARVHA